MFLLSTRLRCDLKGFPMRSILLLAVAALLGVSIIAASCSAEPAPPGDEASGAQTEVPVRMLARMCLANLNNYLPGHLDKLGDRTKDWRATLDPKTFDLEKSWKAYQVFAATASREGERGQLLATLDVWYFLARTEKDAYVIVTGESPAASGSITDVKTRLGHAEKNTITRTIPGIGKDVQLTITPKIVDWEFSDDRSTIWLRCWLTWTASIPALKENNFHIENFYFWIGVKTGKKYKIGDNQVLVGISSDRSKFIRSGECHPDDNPYITLKQLPKEQRPTGR
jgi:hypothetical protein